MNADRRVTLAAMCARIGCAGLSARCPGDPACAILRKSAGHPGMVDLVDLFLDAAVDREDAADHSAASPPPASHARTGAAVAVSPLSEDAATEEAPTRARRPSSVRDGST